MKRTALHLVLALLACLLALPAGATNQRKVAFGLQGPFDCTLCHGSATTGQYWPDGVGGIPVYVDDAAGPHGNHVGAISQSLWSETTAVLLTDTVNGTADAKQKTICAFCHPNPGEPRAGTEEASHLVNAAPVDTVDVHGDGRPLAAVSNFQTITGAAQLVQGSYDNTAVANGKRCSNVDCHYRVPTPTTGVVPDGWNNPLAVATCSNCHGSGMTGAVLPNAHQTHVGSFTTGIPRGKEYACTECHPDYGTNTSHQNGIIDFPPDIIDPIEPAPFGDFSETFGEPGEILATLDTSDRKVKFGGAGEYATCTNFYCHGADLHNGGTNQTPTWNDSASGNCGTCHGINADPAVLLAQGRDPLMAVTTGNHVVHFTVPRGPRLADDHFSVGCYQCHNSVVAANHAADCTDCHYPNGSYGAIAEGATNPTPTHVDGKVDFGNTNQTIVAQSVLGTSAPPEAPDATSTDRCNCCHASGTAAAKINWPNQSFRLGCETCHTTPPATSRANCSGVSAPAKDAFTSRGHGLASGARYPWPDGGPGRDGAGAVCTNCHDGDAEHISHVLGDTDRLQIAGNDLCNNCHDGPGSGGSLGNAVSQVSTHANTSTTMTNVYTRQRPAMELNCIECHDVHGTANIFMINGPAADGPLVAPRLYNGVADTATELPNGTVAFTDDSVGSSTTPGVGYANPSTGAGTYASWICQTCHTQTVHFQFNSNDGHVITDCITCHKHEFDDNYAANSQDGFMPSGCDGCHGYPPVPVQVPATTTPPQENYTGGGGAHAKHVDFLIAKLAISAEEVQGRSLELCGPCHGQDPLGDHAVSGEAADVWDITSRAEVNLVARTASSWGAAGTYGGNSVVAPGTKPPGNAVDTTDSRCANLDCHGDADPAEVLHWNVDMTDGTGVSDALIPSQVCEGCHDQTPAQVRVYPAGDNPPPTYTGNAPDAAANYYGTVSGYSRGGHGDAKIQNEDPGIDSGTGTTPIDCTACHSATAAHFPAVSGDLNRLGANATLETSSHTGLCNDCHNNTSDPRYPAQHHPSFRGTSNNATKDIVVNAESQEIRSAVSRTTNWVDGSGGSCGAGDDFCEQTAYGAANFSGNPDFYVDWWGGNPGSGNQSPPPEPSPFAVLPLLQYVGNQSGPANTVMCVTCHNPHGTDLYVHDTFGAGSEIPDNNMLRLRDSDNTLCNACH